MKITLSLLGVIASVVLLALYAMYRAALPKPIPGIPYNKHAASNILGDVPAVMKWHKETQELYSWTRTLCLNLDSPVIQLFMRPLGRPWVIVSDAREAQDILARRTPREFDRAEFFGDKFAVVIPHSMVVMPTNQEFHKHRRLMSDLMASKFLGEVIGPRIHERSLDLVRLWKEKSRLAEGRPFSAIQDVNRSALDVIFAVAFEDNVGTINAQADMLSALRIVNVPQSMDSSVVFPTAPIPKTFDAILKIIHSVAIAQYSPFPPTTPQIRHDLLPESQSGKEAQR